MRQYKQGQHACKIREKTWFPDDDFPFDVTVLLLTEALLIQSVS